MLYHILPHLPGLGLYVNQIDYVTTMFLGKIDAANQLPVVKVKLKSKFTIHFKSGSRNSKMLNVCEV